MTDKMFTIHLPRRFWHRKWYWKPHTNSQPYLAFPGIFALVMQQLSKIS